MEMLLILIIACAVVGAIIDGTRGALLGGLLGIIGLGIAGYLASRDH